MVSICSLITHDFLLRSRGLFRVQTLQWQRLLGLCCSGYLNQHIECSFALSCTQPCSLAPISKMPCWYIFGHGCPVDTSPGVGSCDWLWVLLLHGHKSLCIYSWISWVWVVDNKESTWMFIKGNFTLVILLCISK